MKMVGYPPEYFHHLQPNSLHSSLEKGTLLSSFDPAQNFNSRRSDGSELEHFEICKDQGCLLHQFEINSFARGDYILDNPVSHPVPQIGKSSTVPQSSALETSALRQVSHGQRKFNIVIQQPPVSEPAPMKSNPTVSTNGRILNGKRKGINNSATIYTTAASSNKSRLTTTTILNRGNVLKPPEKRLIEQLAVQRMAQPGALVRPVQPQTHKYQPTILRTTLQRTQNPVPRYVLAVQYESKTQQYQESVQSQQQIQIQTQPQTQSTTLLQQQVIQQVQMSVKSISPQELIPPPQRLQVIITSPNVPQSQQSEKDESSQPDK